MTFGDIPIHRSLGLIMLRAINTLLITEHGTYPLLPRQMSATSGAKRLWVVSCLLTLHLL